MKLLVFFLMLPHLKPASFEYLWPAIDTIFDVGRVVSTLIIIFLYILKSRLPSKPVWVLAALQGWILFSTYSSDGDIWAGFLKLASIVSVALIIEFFSLWPFEFLSGAMMCFELMLYSNLASVLIYYPNGMYISAQDHYRCYFLGYHNGFILYSLPAIIIALLFLLASGKKARPVGLFIAAILPICITWSATSVCGLLVFAVVLILSKTILQKWITYRTIFISIMCANMLISVFRVMDRVLWMALFIESFLRKQITLTGRTFIWDSFYSLFLRSPWLGYGTNEKIQASNGFIASHMHNQWFQQLFEGGIPALLLFLLLNFIIGKHLIDYGKTASTGIYLAAFAALYVLFITEAYSSAVLYILYPLSYHVEKFEVTHLSAHQAYKINRGHHVQNRKLPEKH